MDLRDFCQRPRYDRVLMTTFAFDPVFFEKVVLPDLRRGGTEDILILCDADCLHETLTVEGDQLRSYGREYLVEPIHINGSFHPKIFFRIGPEGCLLWCGSSNLTRAGWGTNREIGTLIQLETDALPGSIKNIINSLRSFVFGELANRWLDEWAGGKEIETDIDIPIHLSTSIPLIDQLEARWHGRTFDSLELWTGSSDKHGAFLEKCDQIFGVKNFRIHANGQNLDLNRNLAEKLGIQINVVDEQRQRVHAKAYFFQNKSDSDAAVIVGSANCSRAGWLLSHTRRGNIEAIVVHDQVSKETQASLFANLPSDEIPLSELEFSEDLADNNESDNDTSSMLKLDASYSPQLQQLQVRVEEKASVDIKTLTVIAKDQSIALTGPDDQCRWTSHQGIWQPAPGDLLPKLQIVLKSDETWTQLLLIKIPHVLCLKRTRYQRTMQESIDILIDTNLNPTRQWLTQFLYSFKSIVDPRDYLKERKQRFTTDTDAEDDPDIPEQETLLTSLTADANTGFPNMSLSSSAFNTLSVFSLLFGIENEIDRENEKQTTSVTRHGEFSGSTRHEEYKTDEQYEDEIRELQNQYVDEIRNPDYFNYWTIDRLRTIVAIPVHTSHILVRKKYISFTLLYEFLQSILISLYRSDNASNQSIYDHTVEKWMKHGVEHQENYRKQLLEMFVIFEKVLVANYWPKNNSTKLCKYLLLFIVRQLMNKIPHEIWEDVDMEDTNDEMATDIAKKSDYYDKMTNTGSILENTYKIYMDKLVETMDIHDQDLEIHTWRLHKSNHVRWCFVLGEHHESSKTHVMYLNDGTVSTYMSSMLMDKSISLSEIADRCGNIL